MTAPKAIDRREVDVVHSSLLRALRIEYPGCSASTDAQILGLREPPLHSRAHVIWEALKTTVATRYRHGREKDLKASSKIRDRVETFDDEHQIQAIRELTQSWKRARKAVNLLNEYSAVLVAPSAKSALRVRRKKVQELADALGALLVDFQAFRSVSPLRMQREWDLFISETAAKMVDVGFSSREICGILTGTDPMRVDSQTMERFRHRVRRQVKSRA